MRERERDGKIRKERVRESWSREKKKEQEGERKGSRERVRRGREKGREEGKRGREGGGEREGERGREGERESERSSSAFKNMQTTGQLAIPIPYAKLAPSATLRFSLLYIQQASLMLTD